MEEGRSALKILTGKHTGKRPTGRPSHRLEDNIRMAIKEINVNMRNSIDSAQDGNNWRAFVNAKLKLRVP